MPNLNSVNDMLLKSLAGGATLEDLWDATPDGVLVVVRGGKIGAANKAAHLLFDFPDGTLPGRLVEELLPEKFREDHLSHRKKFENQPQSRPMGTGQRLVGRRANGSLFPIHVSLTPIGEDADFTLAMVRDMTDWVAVESDLRDMQRQRDLAEEHERIARELHDTVVQELFAAGMSLQALRTDSDEMDRLAEIVESLDATTQTIRSVIFDLSSPLSSSSGLRGRVLDLLADMATSMGVEPRCNLTGPLDSAVPDDLVDDALAVVREALTNVVRHAGATAVDLRIEAGRDLVVEVVDDGSGLPDELPKRSGLENLAARADKRGGSFAAYRGPAGGTVVEWVVPLLLDEPAKS